MRRLLATLALALLTLALSAAPAQACLWDRDTYNSEREFKSQYQESPGVESLSPGMSSDMILPLAATGSGGLLLIGAFVLALRRPREDR